MATETVMRPAAAVRGAGGGGAEDRRTGGGVRVVRLSPSRAAQALSGPRACPEERERNGRGTGTAPAPLFGLFAKTVVDAEVTGHGIPSPGFDDGTLLSVGPDPGYESWSLTGTGAGAALAGTGGGTG
ncbi:DUF6188 family protein [Streptomyces sp. NPDC056937]|uniref:DUF6188 family protein n=1 Tax=Streptomyces sp. NPDC056937 TaxID=3345969 RepID=UPI003639A273